MIDKKRFLVYQRGGPAFKKGKKKGCYELNLHIMGPGNLGIVFEIVSDLSEDERYALYRGFFQRDAGGLETNIAELREKALKRICHSFLGQQDIHLMRGHMIDRDMTHARFRRYMDDYLADELPETEKASFERHMLLCDFCGDLFLINRDIVEIIHKCGEELFEDIIDHDHKTGHRISSGGKKDAMKGYKTDDLSKNQDSESCETGSIHSGERDRLMDYLHRIKRCPNQFIIGMVLLKTHPIEGLEIMSGILRNLSFSQSLMRFLRMIFTCLRIFPP